MILETKSKLLSQPPTCLREISENLVKPGNDNSTKNRIPEP